jgi:hypothetical protein
MVDGDNEAGDIQEGAEDVKGRRVGEELFSEGGSAASQRIHTYISEELSYALTARVWTSAFLTLLTALRSISTTAWTSGAASASARMLLAGEGGGRLLGVASVSEDAAVRVANGVAKLVLGIITDTSFKSRATGVLSLSSSSSSASLIGTMLVREDMSTTRALLGPDDEGGALG